MHLGGNWVDDYTSGSAAALAGGITTISNFVTLRGDQVAEAMAQAAGEGMGICVLPDLIAAKAFAQGRLVRLLAEHRLHERGIYALYPSRRFLDAKVRTWVEFLKEQLPLVFRGNRTLVENPTYWA